MESKLDIVLLGATGYTGRFAAKHLALMVKEAVYSDITWGIAGRSRKKMDDLLSELEELDVDITKISVLECDIVKKDNTLKEVTRRAKILMNATGPFTLLSGPVVKACIETGTHYVDISAELYHMINIYREFNKSAEEASVLIVPSCGFACIPVTAGLMELERNFKGILHSVECYTEVDIPLRANFVFPGHNNSLIHYGTWESLVHELRNYKQYSELKKITFPDSKPIPEELKKPFFHRHKGRFWYPYPGPENDIMEQTNFYESQRGKTPYYFKIYTTMPLFIHFLILVPVFFIYYYLCNLSCFRKLLWTFPRFFTCGLASHRGPNEKMRNDTEFSFTLNGRGWSQDSNEKLVPDKKLTVKVSGNDPGYRTTAICFVLAAITILRENSNMPMGGVLPTAVAFNKTGIAEKFVQQGIQIETIGQ